MKKQTTIAMALTMGLMMLVGCNKINESVPGSGFRASIEHSGGKTHISPDWGNDVTTDILWSEHDRIKVANQGGQTGCQVHTFELAEGENTTMGLFYTGEQIGDFFEPGYMAIYPARNAEGVENTISGTTATFHIPETQYYKENSFGEGSLPMVAYSETQSLSFKNLLGGLCVPITGGDVLVKRIVLISNNPSDNLCGTFTVECDGGNNNYSLTSQNATPCPSVTLDCGDGVQLNANDSVFFCIMVPPGTMCGTGENAGFRIDVYNTDYDWVNTLSAPINPNITRNKISLVSTKQDVGENPYADLDHGDLLMLCLYAILALGVVWARRLRLGRVES